MDNEYGKKNAGMIKSSPNGCKSKVTSSSPVVVQKRGVSEGYKAWGTLQIVQSNTGLGKCLFEGVFVTSALYGAEAWGMRSAKRRKVNFF